MQPLTPEGFYNLRKKTDGCRHIKFVDYEIKYKDETFVGVIEVNDDDHAKVPMPYGSVVGAALDRQDWYETLGIPRPETGLGLSNTGEFQCKPVIPVFATIGYSDHPPTIYVQGVIEGGSESESSD